MLKFFTYDSVVKGDLPYPIEKTFKKFFTTNQELHIMFPNQIWLSQEKAHDEVSISHLPETANKNYEHPGGTYAYTTSQPMVYLWDQPVSIESFWLRLHRAPNPFTKIEMGLRTV
jgi:hypothetical protein